MQENQHTMTRYLFMVKPFSTLDVKLHDTLLQHPLEGTIQSAFAHAINIVSLQHTPLITLVTEEVPCSAYCLKLPQSEFQYFERMQGTRCTIELLDTGMPIRVFDASVPQLSITDNAKDLYGMLAQRLLEQGNPGSVIPREDQGQWGQVLSHTLENHTQQLVQAARAQDRQTFLQGFDALCGLGIGLTPSGDDICAGFITALHATRSSASAFVDVLASDLLARAAAATNEISITQLRHALDQQANEHVHQLINELNEQDNSAVDAALKRIISIGSSSGTDFLYGFLAALQLFDSPTSQASSPSLIHSTKTADM